MTSSDHSHTLDSSKDTCHEGIDCREHHEVVNSVPIGLDVRQIQRSVFHHHLRRSSVLQRWNIFLFVSQPLKADSTSKCYACARRMGLRDNHKSMCFLSVHVDDAMGYGETVQVSRLSEDTKSYPSIVIIKSFKSNLNKPYPIAVSYPLPLTSDPLLFHFYYFPLSSHQLSPPPCRPSPRFRRLPVLW